MNDNIYQVGNTYRVKVFYYENGIHQTKSKSFSFKKYGSKQIALAQAKLYRDNMKVRLNTSSFILPDQFTISGLYDLRKQLLPKSNETERKLDYYFEKYFPKERSISNITSADIQRCLNSMITTNSDDTIKRVFSIWRDIYRVCAMKELDVTNKTLAVTLPKSRKIYKKREMDFDMSNFEDLLIKIKKYNSCSYDSYLISLALRIMYVTGMRPAEVYALTKNDIDIKNRFISINKSSNGYIVNTKNEQSYDRIPFSESAVPLFIELLKINNDQLFLRSNGELLDSRFVTHVTNTVSNGSFRPYMMRHKFSTELIENNVDLRTIGELMRHKDINQVLRYARSNKNKKEEAIKDRYI